MTERTQEHLDAELTEVDAAIRHQETGDEVPRTPPAETAAEKEAGALGWVPKDKFKGDPAKWKPAEQYIGDGNRYRELLKGKVAHLEKQNAKFEELGKKFAQFHEESMARKDEEIKALIAENNRKYRAAIRDGDDDLAESLEQRRDLLLEEQRKNKTAPDTTPVPDTIKTPNSVDPLVKEWIEDGNEWFENDEQLRVHAITVGNEMRRNGVTLIGRDMLDAVAAQVQRDFPRRFKKAPEAKSPNLTSSDGGRTGDGGGEHSLLDLPAEDLSFMKEGIAKKWFTKESFLNNYFSGAKKTHSTKS